MSSQQIWISLDALAHIASDTNNDLAHIFLAYAREQEILLAATQSTSRGWHAKAEEYKRLLNEAREFLQDLQATCKEYFPDDQAKRDGYACAVGDIIASIKVGDSL